MTQKRSSLSFMLCALLACRSTGSTSVKPLQQPEIAKGATTTQPNFTISSQSFAGHHTLLVNTSLNSGADYFQLALCKQGSNCNDARAEPITFALSGHEVDNPPSGELSVNVRACKSGDEKENCSAWQEQKHTQAASSNPEVQKLFKERAEARAEMRSACEDSFSELEKEVQEEDAQSTATKNNAEEENPDAFKDIAKRTVAIGKKPTCSLAETDLWAETESSDSDDEDSDAGDQLFVIGAAASVAGGLGTMLSYKNMLKTGVDKTIAEKELRRLQGYAFRIEEIAMLDDKGLTAKIGRDIDVSTDEALKIKAEMLAVEASINAAEQRMETSPLNEETKKALTIENSDRATVEEKLQAMNTLTKSKESPIIIEQYRRDLERLEQHQINQAKLEEKQKKVKQNIAQLQSNKEARIGDLSSTRLNQLPPDAKPNALELKTKSQLSEVSSIEDRYTKWKAGLFIAAASTVGFAITTYLANQAQDNDPLALASPEQDRRKALLAKIRAHNKTMRAAKKRKQATEQRIVQLCTHPSEGP